MKLRMSFLNIQLIQDLQCSLHEFHRANDGAIPDDQYNYLFAITARLDFCARFLNRHSNCPHSDEALLTFMMYSCMLIDGIKQLLKILSIDVSVPDEQLYFGALCKKAPLNLSESNCPTDDKFFEYFRALTFAHPFETSRPKFLQSGEVQYSPWVIVNHVPEILDDSIVGVRIFSNKHNRIIDLEFPFETLKGYIKSRYNLIASIIKWVNT